MITKDIIKMLLDKQLSIKLVEGNRTISGKEDAAEAIFLILNMELGNQKATDKDLIDAAKYGYEYHQKATFPENKFEDECINNFKQHIQSKDLNDLLNKEKGV